MRWETIKQNDTWLEKYNLAKAYYEHHGNLEIPQKFETINGYEYQEGGLKLGKWLRTQRQAYKGKGNYKITQERIELLEKIGMRWEPINQNDTWMEKYQLAKAYYQHHGNLEMPDRFETINGYEYQEGGVKLGFWLHNKRQAYKGKGNYKFTKEQIELLEQIGMRWENIDQMDTWLEKYNLAKAYYEHHGNLEIPGRFETINGYEYQEGGLKLGKWLRTQRLAYKGKGNSKLTQERVELLEKIRMRWENIDQMDTWLEKYNLAKAYYEHHGNLEIPDRFETVNGYEYQEGGLKLGKWLRNQRQAYKGKENYKFTKERVELLEQIGMIWEVRKNKETIENVCKKHGINYQKNEKFLEHISIQEFVSKIALLKEMKLPIINNKGLLSEIFYTNRKELKKDYGVTLEEMIEKYYHQKQIRGV